MKGFARYSTDSKWHVPHFEKMLYDQGQLAVSFSQAFQATKDPKFAKVVRDIVKYVNRDLRHPMGGYYRYDIIDLGICYRNGCNGFPVTFQCRGRRFPAHSRFSSQEGGRLLCVDQRGAGSPFAG